MLIKNLKQKRVIPYLLAAPSGEEGCKRAVSNAAVYKWLKNEIFKGELRREPNAVIGWALDSLKANLTKSGCTLTTHLDSKRENISMRALAGHSSGRTIFELPIPI
jgi:hypothetical protein